MGQEEQKGIINQASSVYNEFAVPGNISASSRNETSIRKKKSKKIFDPSEQDQPSRKRKGSESSGGYSQSAFPQASNAALSNSCSPRSGQVARQNNASLSPSI